MAAALDLVVGMRHGDTCTCTPLDPITMTARPVVVSPDCPGKHDTPRDRKMVAGNVVITWSRPVGDALAGWAAQVTDAETGAEWCDAISMRISVDSRNWVTADIERLVDENGAPDETGRGRAVPTEDGAGYRTAVLRYAVAAMRVAEPDSEQP